MSETRFDVVVLEKITEAEDIVSFTLARPDGMPLPPFEAGAHIDVELGAGLVRQYSLCNAPGERHRYRIGVLREGASRGGSRLLHDVVGVGARLTIGAPRNLFALAPAAHAVLVAGGIGITPLLAMAESLAASGSSFQLHYCARSLARMAFRERIGALAASAPMFLHVDGGPDRFDLAAALAQAPRDSRLYVCGPAGFMDAVTAAAAAHGWPSTRTHLERFSAAAPCAQERSFELVLGRSGARISVPPGRSVTAVLGDHGVFVPVSCEQGICGTCVTAVLDGVPEHRDSYLTEEEQAGNRLFTPCCSRALSERLVIDL